MGSQAFVSDQSTSFASLPIGTGPDFTIVAALELPPGSWVVFATVAFAGVGATGTGVVQTGFLLDGQVYSPFVQSDFVAPDGNGFRVVPLTTGLALDRPQTVQVGCVASQTTFVSSQPTTITAIQVESVTRIQDQSPGIP